MTASPDRTAPRHALLLTVPLAAALLALGATSGRAGPAPLATDTLPIGRAVVDADGDFVPDRVGDTVSVEGRAVVASGVLHGSRLSVYLQDGTGGVQLFGQAIRDRIRRGDRVRAVGTLTHYRGQAQLQVHGYRVLPSTRDTSFLPVPLVRPDSATLEAHEGRLVRLSGVVTGGGQNDGGEHLWIQPEEGDRRVQLFAAAWRGSSVDLGRFEHGDRIEVTGLLGQYDWEAPYTSSYQIYPRAPDDLRGPDTPPGWSARSLTWAGGGLLGALLFGLGLWGLRNRRALSDLRDRHRVLFERNQAGVCLATVEGQILDCNAAMADMYGYDTAEQMIGRRAWDLYDTLSDRERYLREIREDGEVEDYLHHHRTRDGKELWVLENAVLVETADGEEQIVGTVVDLTERVLAERRQEAAEERHRALFEQNVAGAFRSSPGGTLLQVNPAFARMLGYDGPEQLEGRQAKELYRDPERRDELMRELDADGNLHNKEIALRSRDGETVWVLENSFVVEDPETGEPVNIGTVTEITEHVREERELEELAHRDALTGIPNRRYLEDTVPRILAQARREGGSVGLVYVDLNDFKEINDRWGHAAGDAVLRAVGERLQASLRESDLAGRVGGDEFLMVLPGLERKADALEATRRVVQEAFAEPVEAAGEVYSIGAKLGVAVCPEDGTDFDTLLQRADRAMYRASRSGQDLALFDEAVDQPYMGRLHRRRRIHEALENGDILGYVQPIYALGDRRLAGVELLARWRREDEEVTGAGELIEAARAVDLLADLDREMLRQAARFADRWRTGTVSVNTSLAFLKSDGAADVVRDVLREHPAAGDYLTLEVTERTALHETAAGTVKEISEMGLRMSLDDFGTGYSSLSVLEDLPVDEVKTDRSLLRGVGRSRRAEDLVRGVLDLAHAVRALVVAEGVERPDQLDWLCDAGCDLAQGFLLGRPERPEADLPSSLDARAVGSR